MAVNARLRYEVLRRDGYACRYCGAKAPEVALHVDHVVPVALGGSDDPSNLTASCEPCNAGKASAAPDAPTVAEVDARHLRWRAALAQAAEELTLVDPEVQKAIDGVREAFDKFRPLTSAQEDTIAKYVRDGLPAAVVIDAAWIAIGREWVALDGMFAYAMGICRNKLHQMRTRAKAIMETQEVVE